MLEVSLQPEIPAWGLPGAGAPDASSRCQDGLRGHQGSSTVSCGRAQFTSALLEQAPPLLETGCLGNLLVQAESALPARSMRTKYPPFSDTRPVRAGRLSRSLVWLTSFSLVDSFLCCQTPLGPITSVLSPLPRLSPSRSSSEPGWLLLPGVNCSLPPLPSGEQFPDDPRSLGVWLCHFLCCGERALV